MVKTKTNNTLALKDCHRPDMEERYPESNQVSSGASTMNSIKEEENNIAGGPGLAQCRGTHTPLGKTVSGFSVGSSNSMNSGQKVGLQQSPSLTQPPHGLYSSHEGNNSSSSLIYNSSFTFGGTGHSSSAPAAAAAAAAATTPSSQGTLPQTPQQQQQPQPQGNGTKQSNRQSRYIPGPKLAPPTTRTRSPTRSGSPDSRRTRNSRPSSALFEAPFNLGHSPSVSMHTPPTRPMPPTSVATSSSGRTTFRKGHRYKHSSVSMNFFQEPEVKIPLNIAKSLPIPNLHDLLTTLPWPRAHFQLSLTFIQLCICLIVFQLGHQNSWSNFSTLSHFIAYDVIGSIAIILVENLSQFQVWSTGTITYPFGLNRIEVLISFSLAVSMCFVGLDLLFHIVEELVVLFVELSNENHKEIASQIPHSHHGGGHNLFTSNSNFTVWYTILLTNLVVSTISLQKIYYANKYSKLKTKNPIITITYTSYLLIYPYLVGYVSAISDYLAAVFIAVIILFHGLTVSEWTSTVLLMGFSTTNLPLYHFLGNTLGENSYQEKNQLDSMIRKRTISGNVLIRDTPVQPRRNRSWFSLPTSKSDPNSDPTVLKSLINEEIEKLPEYLSKCSMNYDDFFIAKCSFNLYVVLMSLTLKGGSDSDELSLRLAIEKCVQSILPNAETTIEINRI